MIEVQHQANFQFLYISEIKYSRFSFFHEFKINFYYFFPGLGGSDQSIISEVHKNK